MKSSASARDRRRRTKCLIVDGYNVIARMNRSSLHAVEDMDEQRDRLVDALSEYAAYAGEDVVVVFDAHHTADPERAHAAGPVTVVYTAPGETADQYIEREVYRRRESYRQVTVATSDAAEQQVAFGGGALRISADGLIRRLQEMQSEVRALTEQAPNPRPSRLMDRLHHEVASILEAWRRHRD
ncbi:NYN domain-containing protein [Alicyclobacillus sp.]|uniref:NYN domain-containing protein n=1 Tax=Alicyclobacillus sp. TaxID=61169 RepID=UPI0025C16222|nr:NYN domain-containing protein [Alicyclobacillus sp.]MCL6517308.1 NYN domain-containing protein [Alicyclobacillus sp.]